MIKDNAAERAKVFSALLELGTSTIHNISYKAGISRYYIKGYLDELIKDGEVIMTQHKTKQGRSFVAFTPVYPDDYKTLPKVYNMPLRANPGLIL